MPKAVLVPNLDTGHESALDLEISRHTHMRIMYIMLNLVWAWEALRLEVPTATRLYSLAHSVPYTRFFSFALAVEQPEGSR